jgi:FkbH-like protein
LAKLVEAHLRIQLPNRVISVELGLFGDLKGNIDRMAISKSDVGVVFLEWSDFDQRLGTRTLGNWGPAACEDILRNASTNVSVIEQALGSASSEPTVVVLPSLPMPPVGITPGWQGNVVQSSLSEMVGHLASWITRQPNLRLLSPQRLDLVSPLVSRYNPNSDAVSGFPFSIEHASWLADLTARLILGPRPKKGLITDLDDTLWSGIAGEIGTEAVNWDLDHNSFEHGLYQKQLRALAEEGVLLAVASKNDPAVAREALTRADLLVNEECMWPVEAAWVPKSESIGRILRAWNVAATDVVFVDDSPMELDEVNARHPGLECIRFPKGDLPAVYQLVAKLRDLFGKNRLEKEDAIRLKSLRSAPILSRPDTGEPYSPETVLADAKGVLTLDFQNPPDARALELVNKTNQFNLNGKRYAEGEWKRHLERAGRVSLVGSYQDKYGPLGRILVLTGSLSETVLQVDTWVMSCRAFSKNIEHTCLDYLFAKFGLDEIVFAYLGTSRNGPLREFFERVCGEFRSSDVSLSREMFYSKAHFTAQTEAA